MSSDVRVTLARARFLAADPWTLDDAIDALEALAAELAPAFADDVDDVAPTAAPVRTVLSSHLLAVRALQDVDASASAVTRLVLRALDGAEEAVDSAAAAAG